jgi:peptidoglycan hydrolase CwlO-like protein
MINKIIIVFFFVGIFVGIPQFVLAGESFQKQISDWRLETQGWSIEDHMAAAKAQEEEVQSLESRVQQVDERIANLEKKPYFDPKGIKRSALKLLSGNFKSKINLLNERVAWHYIIGKSTKPS